jgi:hypothetical protein
VCNQVGFATFKPGAKDRKKELSKEEQELEEFMFEDQINFVSDQVRAESLSVCPTQTSSSPNIVSSSQAPLTWASYSTVGLTADHTTCFVFLVGVQLLRNKDLLVEEKKKGKKHRRPEDSDASTSSGSESEPELEWKTSIRKPLTEFEKLQVGRLLPIRTPEINFRRHTFASYLATDTSRVLPCCPASASNSLLCHVLTRFCVSPPSGGAQEAAHLQVQRGDPGGRQGPPGAGALRRNRIRCAGTVSLNGVWSWLN